MKLGTWILISAIARIPSIVTSTVSGDSLGEQDYMKAIIAFAVMAVLSLAGILIYRTIIKPRKASKAKNEPNEFPTEE